MSSPADTAASPDVKEEWIRVRVVRGMKKAYNSLARQRLTTESELAREAMLEYLQRRGYTAEQLLEEAPPYKVSPAPAPTPSSSHPAAATSTDAQGIEALKKDLKRSSGRE